MLLSGGLLDLLLFKIILEPHDGGQMVCARRDLDPNQDLISGDPYTVLSGGVESVCVTVRRMVEEMCTESPVTRNRVPRGNERVNSKCNDTGIAKSDSDKQRRISRY